MAAKTTKEIFKDLITPRGWWRDLGLTEDQGNNYRTRFNNGKLSVEKMEEIILKAGYQVVQEKLWALPGENHKVLWKDGRYLHELNIDASAKGNSLVIVTNPLFKTWNGNDIPLTEQELTERLAGLKITDERSEKD